MSIPTIDPNSINVLKTFFQGFFGALTFGAYNQYNFNKIMEQNNEIIKKTNEFNELKHKEEIRVLEDKIKVLEAKVKSSWW